MLFNSFEYALFLPLVFLLYWFVFNKGVRLQNFFLLVAGYVFYGWWDWRFLLLIAFSTSLDFWVGLQLGKTEKPLNRKIIFGLSCLVNLGFLGFFKYYNFFISNLILALGSAGIHVSALPLSIILPVGISFYTFQSLSYTTDVYLKKMKPAKDLILFASFISFFPQLVAGPIERAYRLLPQFENKRQFSYQGAAIGMRQILWGLFKKIVVADTLAGYVDPIFSNYASLPGSTLVLGAVYFAIQIYCDFSGYSSIAVGTARLFGFTLMNNFNYPYFSKSVAEFWRNWHISLTSWFRDYVYFPLGGSYGPLGRTVLNTLIVFALSGLWHGANWTFIVWGLLNGLFIIPTVLKRKTNKSVNTLKEEELRFNLPTLLKIAFTFTCVTFAWIFFRAQTVGQAIHYIKNIFSGSLFTYPVQHGMALALPLIILLFVVEWIRKTDIIFLQPAKIPAFLRWGVYLLMILTCLIFFKQDRAFIYFQF